MIDFTKLYKRVLSYVLLALFLAILMIFIWPNRAGAFTWAPAGTFVADTTFRYDRDIDGSYFGVGVVQAVTPDASGSNILPPSPYYVWYVTGVHAVNGKLYGGDFSVWSWPIYPGNLSPFLVVDYRGNIGATPVLTGHGSTAPFSVQGMTGTYSSGPLGVDVNYFVDIDGTNLDTNTIFGADAKIDISPTLGDHIYGCYAPDCYTPGTGPGASNSPPKAPPPVSLPASFGLFGLGVTLFLLNTVGSKK